MSFQVKGCFIVVVPLQGKPAHAKNHCRRRRQEEDELGSRAGPFFFSARSFFFFNASFFRIRGHLTAIVPPLFLAPACDPNPNVQAQGHVVRVSDVCKAPGPRLQGTPVAEMWRLKSEEGLVCYGISVLKLSKFWPSISQSWFVTSIKSKHDRHISTVKFFTLVRIWKRFENIC